MAIKLFEETIRVYPDHFAALASRAPHLSTSCAQSPATFAVAPCKESENDGGTVGFETKKAP
jgi:hypothetical protein